MAGGEVAKAIYTDLKCQFCATETWVYVAQTASEHLVSITTGILSAYIFEWLKKKKDPIRLQDILTREVRDNVVIYRRAIDKLRECKSKHKESRQLIDVCVLDHGRVLTLIENGRVDDISLLELLEEYRSKSDEEIEALASQYE